MTAVVRVRRRHSRRRRVLKPVEWMILGSVGAVVTLGVVAELFMRVGPSGFVLPKTAPPADAAAPLLPGPAAAPSAAAPGTAEDQAANAEPAVPAGAAGPAPPSDATAGGGEIIDNPVWTRSPTPYDIARLYPQQAMNIGAEGQAVIRCVVATDDSLTACEVVSETPANSGFGAAALQLASLYSIAATQADGSPTAGGRVLIPIDFHLTADDGGPPVAPPPTP